jgi:osmotically-inducible protein OsmY
MRVTLKKPPKERPDRFERAGALAGRAIGSLPVSIRPGSRTPSPPPPRNAALVAGPVLAAAAVAAALKKRSSSAAKASEAAAKERASQTPIENDDTTLARKVETEIFRSPDVPKGDIVVNAAFGKVTLRGSVGNTELSQRLASEAGQVPGVKSVENLLHAPSAEAPASQPDDADEVKARLSANGSGESESGS